MIKKREKYENGLFTVRFFGEDFNTHGVSIYDLSLTLLSIQRIVHKAHLSINGRLVKGATPDKEARQTLALQIGERRRESDAFALIPILADPHTHEYFNTLGHMIMSGVVSYYVRDVLDGIIKAKGKNQKFFIGSIYAEVVNIVDRIDASGGVKKISIGSPLLERDTFAAFDSDTKKYLKSIKNEYFLGSYQEIQGRVYKFYPGSKIVAIAGEDGRAISIFLSDDDFDTIRYHKETKPLFLFRGHPKYPLGLEEGIVSQFEADEIQYIGKK